MAGSTADAYFAFAVQQAAGQSPVYESWCRSISTDSRVLGLIDGLPAPKRQPNLLLAAARSLGAPPSDYTGFRGFLLSQWDTVAAVMLANSTQTNEPARCAVLLPLLAQIAAAENRPLALIEAGASAGLCLYPDRYGYRYTRETPPAAGGTPAASIDSLGSPAESALVMDCAVSGPVPLPAALPPIASRAGVDLNPLDVTSAEDLAWLEACIWPGQEHRLERLHAAARMVGSTPQRAALIAGDLNRALDALISEAPADAAVVVFHSAVLTYLSPADRIRFRDRMLAQAAGSSPGGRRLHWISNEGAGEVPGLEIPAAAAQDPSRFVLHHNGVPAALTGPHGQSLHWLS